jgi:hypothetical protein
MGIASMNFEQATALNSTREGDHRWSRRAWFASLVGSLAYGHLLANRSVSSAFGAEPEKKPAKNTMYRVRSVLDLQGEVRLRNQGANIERKNGKQLIARTAPVRSTSTLDYDEQYVLEDAQGDSCLQYFHEAKTEVNVDGHVTKTELRESCREIVKHSVASGMVSVAPSQPMFAAERDLVEGSLTTMYLDALLTDQQVSIGDKWNVDSEAVAKLFNLDAIHEGKITVCLVELDKEKAQLAIEGKVSGSVRNVATEMVIDGKGTLDRRDGYVSWLAIQTEETREIGEAEPGFKITATIRVLRAPIEVMTHGRTLQEALQDIPSWESAGMLQFQSDHGFYRFLADRRWTTYRDNGEEATLRFIVGNRRVAQCNIANLVDFEPGRQLSMAGFQSDLREVTSRSGHEILEASERLSSTKHRLLRVVVSGSVDGVPVRWIYYHVSNDTGRRLSMTFVFDETSLETFAEQDQQLASTIELLTWPSKLNPAELKEGTPAVDAESAKATGKSTTR